MAFNSTAALSSHSPASCAERRQEVADLIDAAGTSVVYHGPVLDWDTAKCSAICLEFEAPWYTEKQLELVAWASSRAKLKIYVEETTYPIALDIGGRAETGAICVQSLIPISSVVIQDAQKVRVTVALELGPGEAAPHVMFAVNKRPAPLRTVLRQRTSLTEKLRFYLYTWINVIAFLFAVFAPLGSYGFLLVALPAVPLLLKFLGFESALKLDIAAISFWLYRHSRQVGPRYVASFTRRSWGLLAIPISCAALYVLVGLITPLWYAESLSEAINSPPALQKDIELFCEFPERREVRALVSRRFALIRSESGAWTDAVRTIRAKSGKAQDFLRNCMSPWRLGRLFADLPKARDDEARAYYAALIFYASNNDQELDQAMVDARTLLFTEDGKEAGPLSSLAWATFSLRDVKNRGERDCEGKKPADPDCGNRSQQCRKLRDALELLLEDGAMWSNLDRRHSAIYIEARDVAASTRLSSFCSAVDPNDVKAAIAHYEAMLGALPAEPRLDRPLTVINLRNFAEARLMSWSQRRIVKEWAKRCQGAFESTCKEVQEAVIGDGQRKFFSKDRIASNLDWDKPSLSQGSWKDFNDSAMAEAKKYWRKPWVSLSE